MDGKRNKPRRGRVIGASVVSCLVALALAVWISIAGVNRSLVSSSSAATEGFTSIMGEYVRTFGLFERLMQLEVDNAPSEDAIADYLKSNDSQFQAINGSDYDGIYMCYHGRYIYSWSTPYSVYESSGYRVEERPWYLGAVAANGDVWFSVPYQSYANDYMLSTISRLQLDGQTVFAYDIKLGTIESFVESLSLYKGSTTVICDQSGNIIGSTDARYSGGNLLLSDGQYEEQLSQARAEQDAASEADRDKAAQKVANLQAMQLFDKAHGEAIASASGQPDQVVLDLHGASLCFLHTNGTYSCVTVIPFSQVLPGMALTFLTLATAFILAILLWESSRVRMQHARELKVKNAQLAEAVARADSANEAKSQFLAQMSHEIRTPLNAVIGLTGIAKTEVEHPDRVTDDLAKIDGSSRLLLSIINDILDMSAIEGGKLKIDSAPFNLRTLLSNLTTLFYEQARQKGVRFEVRLNGITVEEVVGDELRVNQVLMNLLSNAVKFTPRDGEIVLTVKQASRSQGKVVMRFSVSDTGCGMGEDMLARLFQPFEQESASTARKHGGSGLGMAITKHLVEMMGRSIKVRSELGKGTTFVADVPFGVEEGGSVTVATDFSSVRALVVDDDEDSLAYSGILLDRLGVRHEVASNGESALEALGDAEDKGDPFTLCLIDWKMPGMDGEELTRNIREVFGEDSLIIIASAYDLSEVEASGRAAGSNYFIPKPLFQSTLFNALMRITRGRDEDGKDQQPGDDFDFSGRRVLVAEDVALNMEVAERLLEAVGIEVTPAEDGRRALETFEGSEPGYFDCILMDVNMPVMDGYEATAAIRRLAREDARSIPIYAMTANAFAEDVTAALDVGMNGHIAKPIETAVLYRTLGEAFLEKDGGQSDGDAAADGEGSR